ncbi:alpha/beta hydrolase [Paenibacillus swuensis]|uniref:Alpha/beta hydrolase n=1 Tax=Paenibacillus swuensis TaxID=1178515 RepID=A0A172TEW5_9BACL|nr:alpha/beta hydrolase [Paenibacillus swuensis]ANE45476.1 alpha/beta hydrolase [Paenibacillus swuensis]
MRIEQSIVKTSKGNVQYHKSGNGECRVVLINGGSGPIEGWMRVLTDISQASTVFAYNRLGVAGSDKPKESQDGITIVETLREALTLANFQPPYVLVGHSLGGLYANLFARMYPSEVAGIVFLEASHPKDLLLNQHQGKVVRWLNKALSMFDSFSPSKAFNEVHYVNQTAEQIQQLDAFPEVPVYVVTGGKENRMMPEEARKQRLANQRELLSLSKYSKHIIANNSGHFPQLTEPALVINTIKECVEQVNHRA